MTHRQSYAALIALSALVATPVLAQTSPSTSRTVTSPSTSVTSPAPTPVTPTTTTADTTRSDTYVTSDQQVRASKLIGSSVYNDQKEKVGSIDELLMNNNHDVTSAVLSVGGFLGVGSKLVKVPYDQLHVAGDTVVMPGASKDELTHMPSYSYTGAG